MNDGENIIFIKKIDERWNKILKEEGFATLEEGDMVVITIEKIKGSPIQYIHLH